MLYEYNLVYRTVWKKIKILNIIIYNKNVVYERMMKDELERYLKTVNNLVEYYFVTYDQKQIEEVKVIDNCIIFKGKEDYVPNILIKTIKAIKYCIDVLNIKFDYLIRSNISTIINFKNLPKKELLLNGFLSCCGFFYEKMIYPSGTNIILNKENVDLVLKNIDEILSYNVIDDQSFGIFFSKKKIPLHIIRDNMVFNTYDKDCFIIRNKTNNRNIDYKRIKNIVDILLGIIDDYDVSLGNIDTKIIDPGSNMYCSSFF
jgi:hypothetical protein